MNITIGIPSAASKKVELPSAQSLFIQMKANNHNLGTGTGFVVMDGEIPYLITNWHNLSGLRQDGTILGGVAVPDEIVIRHNRMGRLGEWIMKSEPVTRDYEPLWLEHPRFGKNVDVVALRLTNLDDVAIFPHVIESEKSPDVLVAPGEVVSVVGFPFGLISENSFAIWATGFVATEIDLDFKSLPCFLIDCRARKGQSGSAVIAHRNGPFPTAKGSLLFGGSATELLGVYSGRINEESDLGMVWKKSVILEILNPVPIPLPIASSCADPNSSGFLTIPHLGATKAHPK